MSTQPNQSYSIRKESNLFTLYPHPPYDFHLMLELLRRYTYPGMDCVHGSAYRRVFEIEGHRALVQVTADGIIESPILYVNVLSGNVDGNHLLDRVSHVLAIDSNRAEFFNMMREDAKLSPVIFSLYGLPSLNTNTLFEALMSVIIEQQIAWKAAQRAQRWLLEWGNRTVEYEGENYYAFPAPEQIANASLDDLKPLKITHKRIAMMTRLAREIVSGELTLEELSPQKTYDRLLTLKGIGHWTAAVVVARAFGYRHYLTHNDVALQAAVNRYFYQQTGRATPQAIIDTFARYHPFAGDAAFYTLLRWVFDEY